VSFDWKTPLSQREMIWGRIMVISGLLMGFLLGLCTGLAL